MSEVQTSAVQTPTTEPHWVTRRPANSTLAVTDDVIGLRSAMVNVYFIDVPSSAGRPKWVLVDAGLPFSAHAIRATAAERYGEDAPPEAIILTHAHFDHTGVVRTLAEEWNVPVYAHRLELPYLTGRASYAPPDPWVGGSLALTSPLYPRGPVDLGKRVFELPLDGTVPFLHDWRWIATPGHSPGHISLFRERDRLLIAGDAFVTTRQEYLLPVLAQTQIVAGPPRYFTHDWQQAETSVKTLAALEPEIAATGHGTPMRGETLRRKLHGLANHFREQAVPAGGRYADEPVLADDHGPTRVPPPKPIPRAVLATAAAAAVGIIAVYLLHDDDQEAHRHHHRSRWW
jgi:glyoxylase-like metal-dependent hydrolase (beta-lactamase superfamily II)